MQVKFKKLHPDAVIPSYAKEGDAGLDLTAISKNSNSEFGYVEMGTGLAVEIPVDYVGLIFPRSSMSKSYYTFANAVAVIDSNYRGEIKLRFFGNTIQLLNGLVKCNVVESTIGDNTEYEVGDRIGQLIILPYPQIECIEVDELSETERGTQGFGSTGK